MVERRTLGQNIGLSPSPTHLSHTRNITLSRIKRERYIFIKKCVRSFIEVGHYVWLCSAYICICIFLFVYVLWVYNILSCSVYSTQPRSMNVKILDCGLKVNEFELQSRYTFTFGLISLEKVCISLFLQLWVKYFHCCSSARMALNNLRISICH